MLISFVNIICLEGMTGDVEDDCDSMKMPELEDETCSHPLSSAFTNSKMAVEDACIYTATIPTELADNFPEGSVLQIMPDSAIVAVGMKNENSVIFKDNCFTIESEQALNHLTESNGKTVVDAEENMDIDLNFLNEVPIPDSKCLNGELQGMITGASSHSLNLLQNNSVAGKAKPVQDQTPRETLKDDSVVVIDVTKPIQLSQNSLIVVNGQKCVLQHDAQTGQVLAYPVKEQEKPRRRRGRPKKTLLEQISEQSDSVPDNVDSALDEEREKGLLEVVNDDGALVRRSSRKRKKAKVLRDYETGNLKQELGSDVDDVEMLDKDGVSKKKARGPGRPRKNASEMDLTMGIKYQRGRRKKISAESEATQAFLVQTADGQALMMQVPLSSIPPGISLQEMAQEIANKLNLGLNQANELKTVSTSELALQDHSVGSTTHIPCIQAHEENSMTSQDQSIREVILEDGNSISSIQSTLECSEDVSADQFDPLTDHDFCLPQSSGVQQKEVFNKNDRMKSKVSVKLILPNKDNSRTTHSDGNPNRNLLDKNSNLKNTSEFILNTKELNETLHMEPYTLCFSKATNDINCDTKTFLERNSLQIEGCASETDKSLLHVTPPQSDDPTLEVVLSVGKKSSSIASDDIVVSSSSTPVSGKDLPIHLSAAKQCKICQMPYLKDEEIVQHFKVKHPKCICSDCNYMNEHPYVIKRHAFRHANNGCICKICNKKYKDVYILKMHIKMVHLPPDVLYACEVCNKKFTRKAHLKRHLRIHASVKQYQCPHCDYKGCEKSDITKHLLIHEAPKFKCEICGKAFRHVKNKELHLKRHSGQRDYKCAACGFFGYTYTDIRKHIERRHSVSCPQCKQVFTDSQLLKEHRRVGSCHVDQNNKVENPTVAVVSEEATLLEEMPLNILDQPPVMSMDECSSILGIQNGHLIIESNNAITPDKEVKMDSSRIGFVSGVRL